MAEALGVVASVAQIIDAVSKLKSLWQSVKDAPDDLNDCIKDIQRTTKILDKSKALLGGINTLNDESIRECTQDLDNALTALRNVATDLQTQLNAHKRRGVLKIVLKKNEITKGRQKLERAQSLLTTAQQHLSIEMQLQHAVMAERSHLLLSQVHAIVQMSTGTSSTCSKPSFGGTSLPSKPDPVDTKRPSTADAVYHPLIMPARLQRTSKYYRFQSPQWLSRLCIEIACHKEASLLQWSLTVHNTIDQSGPVYQAVCRGQLDELIPSLRSGHIHPMNRTADSHTLLGLAIYYEQIHLLKYFVTHYSNKSLQLDVDDIGSLICRWSAIDLQLLERLGQVWDLLKSCFDIDESDLEDCFQGREDLRQWAIWLPLTPKILHLGIEALPKEARTFFALQSQPAFAVFNKIKGDDMSVGELLEIGVHCQLDTALLLRQVIEAGSGEWLEWSETVQQIFKSDQGQNHLTDGHRSSLSILWRDSCFRDLFAQSNARHLHFSFAERLNDVLHSWVGFLEVLGIDLVRYGEHESQCGLENGQWVDTIFPWKVLGLEYGSKATDWKAYFAPEGREYDLAGEFWDVVENPESRLIPGSFPKSNMNSYSDYPWLSNWTGRFWSNEALLLRTLTKRKQWLDTGYPQRLLSRRERRLLKWGLEP